MKNNFLAPSLLSADFSDLKNQVKLVEESGAQWLHLDVMDGHYVPNITFGPLVLKALRKHSKMFFDTHLMIENPEKYIEHFVNAGADNVTVHVETVAHLHRTLAMIKSLGCQSGISFNPATPINYDLIKHVSENLDLILIMTVNPGFGGQKFIHSMLEKIKNLKDFLDDNGLSRINIEVDGGISLDTIDLVLGAGANVFVSGSSIFGKNDINKATKDLLKKISC